MYRYITLIFILLFSYANGVVLTPLVEEICDNKISSKNSVKTFTTQNPSNDIIGVEVILQRVLKRQNGKEVRVDVKDEIDWYPKQFILKPKASKNFRVQLNMDQMPPFEYAYRVIVKEHPLNFSKQNKKDESNKVKPTLKMIFNYEGFLFVRKCGYEDELTVKEFNLSKKDKQLELKIKNEGKKSVVPSMKKMEVVLKSNFGEYNINGTINETKRVFPNGENSFIIDIKEEDKVLKLDQKDIIGVEIIKKD